MNKNFKDFSEHDRIILKIVLQELQNLKLYSKDKDNYIEFELGRKRFKLIRLQ